MSVLSDTEDKRDEIESETFPLRFPSSDFPSISFLFITDYSDLLHSNLPVSKL